MGMKKKITRVLLPFCYCFFVISIVLGENLYNKKKYYELYSLYINPKLELSYLSNRTLDGWEKSSGYKYINNQTNKAEAWKDYIESKFSLESYLSYGNNLKAMFELDFYGSDYNSLWYGINDINRLRDEKKYVALNKLEVDLKNYFYNIRFFRGIPHYNWKYSGDLFEFYKEQFDTNRYLNISGRPVPEGLEISYDLGELGNINAVYGEPIWGSKDSLYLKYNYNISYFNTYLLYRHEKLPWEASDGFSYKESYAISSIIEYLLPVDVSIGAMYQPFRKDVDYMYVEEAAPGSGDFSSKYIKKSRQTDDSDAMGYAITFDYKNEDIIDNVTLQYKYLNLLAGNKNEIKFTLDKNLFYNFLADVSFLYRQPIREANPLIYEGSQNNTLKPYISPRGENASFWVDETNREKTSIDFSLAYFYSVYNPNVIYNYELGNIEEWNLNKDDNSGFACLLNYRIDQYKGSTDSQFYYDENGNVIWESLGSSGLWEPKDPLGVLTFYVKGRYVEKLYFNFFIQSGNSLATGSYPYMDKTLVPITNFVDTNLNIGFKDYNLNLKYAKDSWGWEEWHRRFGITYDDMYKVEVSKDFREFGIFALSYLTAHQDKYKNAEIDMPSFEEIMIKWIYNFERIYLLKKDPASKKRDELENKTDVNSPEIFVSLQDTSLLTLNEDTLNDVITFKIDVKEESDINDWVITIVNEKADRVIFKKEGIGTLPSFFEWVPSKSEGDLIVNGKYYIKIVANDIYDNKGAGNLCYFDIYKYKGITTREQIKQLRNTPVKISESVNLMSFSYNLKAIYNINEGMPIDKVVLSLKDILNKENVSKIKVITYVDRGRLGIEDKNLAKKISLDISKLFINSGILADRVEIIGISRESGEDKKDDNVEIIAYFE